jgi:hypothetical protein
MPVVTQLQHTGAAQLAHASGAPRPLLPEAARRADAAPGALFELRPSADPPDSTDPVAAAVPGPADHGAGALATGAAVEEPGLEDGRNPVDDAGPAASAPADADPAAVRRIAGIARSVALGALEVLGGSRPLQQLARWLDPENYERLQLRANLVRCINDAPAGRGAETAPSAHRHVIVRSARVCPVGPGVYEASVVAYDQKRVRAVALRIEQRRGAWRVTALEIG